jgi:hypothetical protein
VYGAYVDTMSKIIGRQDRHLLNFMMVRVTNHHTSVEKTAYAGNFGPIGRFVSTLTTRGLAKLMVTITTAAFLIRNSSKSNSLSI